jgi:7,8-dihydro-6-hydroxymethylpterin dimethyltransferase
MDVKRISERARSFKPQREFNILFAGGEPTIAQNFLAAVSYAWSAGFKRICVVTNGIRLGQEDDFAARMRAAGVHQVYLQLDGTSNEAHRYHGAANLFDVKQHARENIARAGMLANLQVAVTKGVNNDSVGDVVRFAVENSDKVRSVLFQPIMFAGRDTPVTDQDRAARRYTLADLAHDLRKQTSAFERQPLRDWFPIAAYSASGNLFDNMRPLRDVVAIADEGGDLRLMKARLAISVARNFDARRAPVGLTLANLWPILEQLEIRYKSDALRRAEEPRTIRTTA